MKRPLALAAVAAALAVAACDDPDASREVESWEPPAEPAAPAVEDTAEPADTVTPVDPAPQTDATTLAEEKRSSEESVQPDSETLFY